MRNELRTLEEKINAFDKYCKEHLDPKDPTKFIGPDPKSPERAELDKWGKELLDLANKANPFNNKDSIESNVRDRALVQLQFIKLGQDASNAYMDPKTPVPTDKTQKAAYDEKVKKAAGYAGKYAMSLNGVQQGTRSLSSAIDLNYITWLASSSPKEVHDALDAKPMEQVINDSRINYDVKKNACVQFTAFAPLMPSKDGKGYTIDHAKAITQSLEELGKDSRIKEMIKNYASAEKAWVTSSIPESTEIQYRIGFLNTYKEELKAINAAVNMANMNDPNVEKAVNAQFEKMGLTELMKDYRGTMDPKTASASFLTGGMNSFEYDFRKAMAEEAKNNPVNATSSKEVIEFRKFLLNNCKDSNRHVVDDFNALPENEQLKVMMTIQNKEHADLTRYTDQSIKNYKPDMAKIKANMSAPKWQFWKKITKDTVNWNFFKKVNDKVLKGKNVDVNDPSKKLNVKSDKISMLTGKVKKTVDELGVVNLGLNDDLYDKEKRAERSESQHMEDVSKELGYAKKAAKEIKTAAKVVGKIPGMKAVGKCTGYLNVGVKALETAENAQKLKVAKYREEQGKQLAEDIKGVDKTKLNQKEQGFFERLKNNARIQKVINKFKTKQAKLDVAKSAVSTVSSTALAAGSKTVGVTIAVVSGAVTAGVQKNIDTNSQKEIVDAKLYESEADERSKIAETKKNLDRKYMKMSPQMQKKYKKYFEKEAMHTAKLKDVNRQEALRKSGENSMNDLKNTVISDVKKDTTMLMKEVKAEAKMSGTLTEYQQKQVALTEKLATAVGVDYDITKTKFDNILDKQKDAPQKQAEKQTEKQAQGMVK